MLSPFLLPLLQQHHTGHGQLSLGEFARGSLFAILVWTEHRSWDMGTERH